ncbi:MAG: tetratricopeptide repeat protein, partial [Terracidiphilus sp.]
MRILPYLLSLSVVVASAAAALRAQTNRAAHSREELLAQQAQQAMAAGRFDQAEAAYLELAKLDPNVAEIYANLGADYFQEGKLDDAINTLHHALRLKPSLTRTKSLLAICLTESGRSAEAVPGLEDCFRSSAEPQLKRQCGLELLRAYSALHRDADAVETSLALNKAYPD